MDKQSKKISPQKSLLAFGIALLCILGILFWKTHAPKPVAPVKEAAKPKKEEPAKLAKSVLRSTLAGSWYPADANILSRQIASFFEKAEVEPVNNVIALILPARRLPVLRPNGSFWIEDYR